MTLSLSKFDVNQVYIGRTLVVDFYGMTIAGLAVSIDRENETVHIQSSGGAQHDIQVDNVLMSFTKVCEKRNGEWEALPQDVAEAHAIRHIQRKRSGGVLRSDNL